MNKLNNFDLKKLKSQLKRSELIQSSLYKIAQAAHDADSLNDLYFGIHTIISKLMYANNFYIAIYNQQNNSIHFPYYVDEKDKDYVRSSKKGTHNIEFDRMSLTGHCLSLGVPLLYSKSEMQDLTRLKEINPLGTLSETWLGSPLKISDKTIGVIVVQSYDKKHLLTVEDRDLLNFVSELVAMVIQRKQLENSQLEYQSNLENKIRERTKELFFAKEKAESAAQAKSEFLANMSHELRTPLNAILGFCEILIEDAADSGLQSYISDLNKIHKSGIDLLALINDILDLSKIEVKKVDLNISSFILSDLISQVSQTLEPYAKINNNIINIDQPDELIYVDSDELKVRQILFNLLTNACKNCENNSIWLKVKLITKDMVDYIQFSVLDSGVGMPGKLLREVFEPFKQGSTVENNKIKGTGLGLSISLKYSELLGGTINAKSEEGKGSEFTFSIRQNFHSKSIVNSKDENDIEQEAIKFPEKGKVLIIDDDLNFLDIINRKLSNDGYLVFTANSGKKGIEKAKKILPDIIILDIIMPDIDGWTVYQRIKKIPLISQIPILIATIGDYDKMAKDFGIIDFLSKPIKWELLNKTLKKYQIKSQIKHILVIDDDESTRTILRKMLIKDGWRVDEAENGKMGLDRVKYEKPELILLDLLMPIMDGFSFLNELKKINDFRHIPIVVITSKDLSADDYSFLTGKVDKVIQKGKYKKDEILKQIDVLIKESKLNPYIDKE